MTTDDTDGRTVLSDDIRAHLVKPLPAVVGVTRADGQPVTAATWYKLVGDQLLLSMQAGQRRHRHLLGNPRLSLTVLGDSWYSHVTVLGRVARFVDDPDLTGYDELALHYTGNRAAQRKLTVVAAYADITAVHVFGKPTR
jgi:Pyridoxamine 5'-phosphate oxidase